MFTQWRVRITMMISCHSMIVMFDHGWQPAETGFIRALNSRQVKNTTAYMTTVLRCKEKETFFTIQPNFIKSYAANLWKFLMKASTQLAEKKLEKLYNTQSSPLPSPIWGESPSGLDQGMIKNEILQLLSSI